MKFLNRLKDKYEQNKILMGYAYYGTQKNVGEIIIERYDTYRRYSPWAILVLVTYFFFSQEWVFFFVTASFLHLHILFNQLWWKLKNIEHYYIRQKEEEDKLASEVLQPK